MQCETGLQVVGLVLVPEVALGEAVNHAEELGKLLLGFGTVFEVPELTDGRTRGFLVVAIVQALLFVLTNALLG